MKARKIIWEGGFDPEDVVYLTDVLETVWQEIEAEGHQGRIDRTSARERLALLIMASAKSGITVPPEEFRARVKRAFLGHIRSASVAAE